MTPDRRSVSLALIVLIVLGVAASAAATVSDEAPPDARSEYSILQMNLCLSGLAGCYAGTHYPAVVDEAIAKIGATGADAVTLDEACSGDVERIARETGYDHEFATVIYGGAPLPCRNPGERGVFGNAVLTRDDITGAESAPYQAQLDLEERRWVCVTTTADTRVCTSHLSVGGTRATNDAQCAELAEVLARGDRQQATVFGGDVNRQTSCAPPHTWTERDEEAAHAPGIQHVYGTSPGLVRSRDEVLPMRYSDHDALLVRALLRP